MAMLKKKVINILMADDDQDDRYFFAKALKSITINTKLVTVEDGDQLMNYLKKPNGKVPDVLFLDINMPRKNGYECLSEIKANQEILDFPVIMYSTSVKDSMAELLYQQGAHYYLKKGDFADLIKYLRYVLTKTSENGLQRPSKEKFLLNALKVS
jgi:CheY-like chemotaxis protein